MLTLEKSLYKKFYKQCHTFIRKTLFTFCLTLPPEIASVKNLTQRITDQVLSQENNLIQYWINSAIFEGKIAHIKHSFLMSTFITFLILIMLTDFFPASLLISISSTILWKYIANTHLRGFEKIIEEDVIDLLKLTCVEILTKESNKKIRKAKKAEKYKKKEELQLPEEKKPSIEEMKLTKSQKQHLKRNNRKQRKLHREEENRKLSQLRLDGIKIPIPFPVKKIMQRLLIISDPGAARTYLDGGYVRTQLRKQFLSKEDNTEDFDITTGASEETILKVMPRKFVKIPYGDHLFLFKSGPIEICQSKVLMDIKTYPSTAEALIADAKNRDFKMNTCVSTHLGEVYDPLGEGLESIRNETLETIISPNLAFPDDPIKMIRAERFKTTLALKENAEIDEAIIENKSHLTLFLLQEHVFNPAIKINSWLYKLFCTGTTPLDFHKPSLAAIMATLFPSLKITPWLEHELSFIKSLYKKDCRRKLNYVYALFITNIQKSTAVTIEDIVQNNKLLEANFTSIPYRYLKIANSSYKFFKLKEENQPPSEEINTCLRY